MSRVRAMLSRSFVVYACIFLAGTTTISYQVILIKKTGLIFGNTLQSFSTVVSGFLLGFLLGASLSPSVIATRRRSVLGFALAQALIAVSVMAFVMAAPMYSSLHAGCVDAAGTSRPCLSLVSLVLVASVAVPATLMGASFFACSHIGLHQGDGDAVRKSYNWSNLGSALGVWVCGFILIPLIGVSGTLRTFVVINVLCAVIMIAHGVSTGVADEHVNTLAREVRRGGRRGPRPDPRNT